VTIFNCQLNPLRSKSDRSLRKGALALGLLVFVGCASELDKNQDYDWAFTDGQNQGQGGSTQGQGGSTQGQGGSGPGSGGSTPGNGGSNNVPADPACFTSIVSSSCSTCHSAQYADLIGGGLDLTSPNIGQRLRNKPSSCAQNPPIINTADKNNSTLLKKVTNQATGCSGGVMPPSTQGLQGADLDCVKNWIMGF
jgi:hypothetical protein